MRAMGRMKRAVLLCMAFVLLLSPIADCLALLGGAIWPEASGDTRRSNGSLVLDVSHMEDGYIMAKGPKTSKKLKLRIKKGDTTLNYDLNGKGEYEVIPLQLGSGKYACTLYKNVSGKRYAEEGRVNLNVKLSDEHNAFLCPNQYVNYTQDSAAVSYATELCQGKETPREKFEAISHFLRTGIVYDYVKMVTVQVGAMPDIEGTFSKRMGICQDLAALAACMLRSQGVPAKFMIGTVNETNYHAWVVVIIDGEEILYDPTAELNAIPADSEYVIERFY